MATFRQLIQLLADRIGDQHVPICRRATQFDQLLGHDAVHHELIHRTVRAIHKANRCYHLDAILEAQTTFAVLGKIRAQLVQSDKTDIDQLMLVDNIAGQLPKFFMSDDSVDHETKKSEAVETTSSTVMQVHFSGNRCVKRRI